MNYKNNDNFRKKDTNELYKLKNDFFEGEKHIFQLINLKSLKQTFVSLQNLENKFEYVKVINN